MSITYTWKIIELRTTKVAEKDVVVFVAWQKIGTDENGNVGVYTSTQPFELKDIPSGYEFTDLGDLTEETVVSWIKPLIGDGFEVHIDAQIQKKIEEAINPVVTAELPWSN